MCPTIPQSSIATHNRHTYIQTFVFYRFFPRGYFNLICKQGSTNWDFLAGLILGMWLRRWGRCLGVARRICGGCGSFDGWLKTPWCSGAVTSRRGNNGRVTSNNREVVCRGLVCNNGWKCGGGVAGWDAVAVAPVRPEPRWWTPLICAIAKLCWVSRTRCLWFSVTMARDFPKLMDWSRQRLAADCRDIDACRRRD